MDGTLIPTGLVGPAAPDDDGPRFMATRFDGRSAQGRPVVLHVGRSGVRVIAADDDRPLLWQGALHDVRWSEAFLHAPRQAVLPDGSTLEINDRGQLDAALAAGGLGPSRVVQLQRRWPAALASLLAVVALSVASYVYGLPAAAKWIAFNITDGFEQRFGQMVLDQMDSGDFLSPSTLSPERQAQLAARFAPMAARAAPDVRYQLVFRNADGPAAVNAFALPGGIIVLLDGLAGGDGRLTLTDEQLMAVLGHELGHVKHRHVMRRLVQTAGTAVGAAVLWGDFAGLAANATVLLGALQYTRDFEREADDFAVAFLRANGLTPSPLLDLFRQIESLSGGDRAPAFLSTHPALRERQQRLQSPR